MAKSENIYEGNLIIRTDADAKKYATLTKVTGYLSINGSAKLDAPALTSVGGYLYINGSAKLDALTSVGGYLSINGSAKLDALTSVGGYLSIYSSAKLDAPALTSVGGYLYIYSSAKLDAPALTSVGGYLYINGSAKLDALTGVGGYLYIYSKGSLTANRLYTGCYDKFKVIDGIGCVVLSEKRQGDVTVLMCRHSKIKKQKVVGEKFYVAQKGGDNAHGKTIAEAVQELQFKIGPRDVSQYRNMPRDTEKSPAEWAIVYRMVTGACQMGVKAFMESRGTLKKTYSLNEILDATKGAYGHERFSDVVAGDK